MVLHVEKPMTKLSIGYVTGDSDANPMLKSHAYLAVNDGFVAAYVTFTTSNHAIRGYVGLTDDPAGAGNLIQTNSPGDTGNAPAGIFFAVAKGEYFEITVTTTVTPTIRWKSLGLTLQRPVDQD